MTDLIQGRGNLLPDIFIYGENMKYTTLLFDLDNTLLDFNKAEENAIIKIMEQYGIEPSSENIKLYSGINDKKWKALERREITKERLLVERFEDFFKAVGVDADCVRVNLEYREYLAQGRFLVDGALEVCRELKKKYKMHLITNGTTAVQKGRLDGTELRACFDRVFISDEIGFVKPEKEFFDYVLKATGETDRTKILVIGDSLSSDIAGAVNSGFDSCWLNHNGEHRDNPATYEIFDIRSLLELCIL